MDPAVPTPQPPSWLKVSLPTKEQAVHGAEVVAITFLGAFLWAWFRAADPFTKAAIVGAWAGGYAAVYALVKAFVTNL